MNALTEKEELFSEFSDAFKEVNGFRPRFGNDWSIADLKAELDSLREAIHQIIAEEEEADRKEKEALKPSKPWAIGDLIPITSVPD